MEMKKVGDGMAGSMLQAPRMKENCDISLSTLNLDTQVDSSQLQSGLNCLNQMFFLVSRDRLPEQ